MQNALREMVLDVRAEARAAAAAATSAAEAASSASSTDATQDNAATSRDSKVPEEPKVTPVVPVPAAAVEAFSAGGHSAPLQTAGGQEAPTTDALVTQQDTDTILSDTVSAAAPAVSASGDAVHSDSPSPHQEQAAAGTAAASAGLELGLADDEDVDLSCITWQHVKMLQANNMLLTSLTGLSGAQEAAVTRGSVSRVPALAMEEPVTSALLARVLAVARVFTRLVVQQAAEDGTPLPGLDAWRAMPHPFTPVSDIRDGKGLSNAPKPPPGSCEAVDSKCLPPLLLHSREVPWHHAEVLRFASGFAKMGKDFTLIGTSVGSRTVQQTVAYYYGPWRGTPFYKRYVEQKLTKTEAQLNHEWQAYRSRAWFHFWRFDDSALTEQELAAGVLQLVDPGPESAAGAGGKRGKGGSKRANTPPSILAPMRSHLPLMLLTDPLFVDCSPTEDSATDPGSEVESAVGAAAAAAAAAHSLPGSPCSSTAHENGGSPAHFASDVLIDVLSGSELPSVVALAGDSTAEQPAASDNGEVSMESWDAALGSVAEADSSLAAPAKALAAAVTSEDIEAPGASQHLWAKAEGGSARTRPVPAVRDSVTADGIASGAGNDAQSEQNSDEADTVMAGCGPAADEAQVEVAPDANVEAVGDVMKGAGEGRAFPSFVHDIVGTLAEVGVDCAAVRQYTGEGFVGDAQASGGQGTADVSHQGSVHEPAAEPTALDGADDGGQLSSGTAAPSGAADDVASRSLLVSSVRRSGRRRRRSSMLGDSSGEDSDEAAPGGEGAHGATERAAQPRRAAKAAGAAAQSSVSLLETLDRQHAEMPHASRKSLAGAVSWTKDRDIDNEPFCTLCGDGGDLVCCDGDCRRSFHMDCIAKANLVVKGTIRDTPGLAQDALLSRLLDIDKDHWTCLNCATGVHDCFLCGSPGMAGVHVFRCQRMCGKYYHMECLAADPRTMWFSPPGTPLTTQAQEGSQPPPTQPAFSCPFHSCTECGAPFDAFKPRTTVYRCQACPTAYHASCLPAEARMDVNEVVTCNHGAAHATKRFDSQYHSGVSLFVSPPPKQGHSAAPPGSAAAAASELIVPIPEEEVDSSAVPSRLAAHAEAVSKLRPNTVPWWFAASTSHDTSEFSYVESATASLAAAVAFVSGAGYSSVHKAVPAPPAEAHLVHTQQGGAAAPAGKRSGLLDVAVHLGVTPGQRTLPDAPLLSPDLSQVDYGLVACSDRLGPRLEAPSNQYSLPKAVPFSSSRGAAMLLSGSDAAFARTLGLSSDEIIAMCQLVGDETLSLMGMHLASQGSKPALPQPQAGAVAVAAMSAAAAPAPAPSKPSSALQQHVGPALGMRHATDWQSAQKASFPKQPKWARDMMRKTPAVRKALALAAAEWNTGVRVSTEGEAVRMDMAQEVVTPTLQSKFTGTKRVKMGRNKWYARLFVGGKTNDIGTWPGEIDAACAWDDVCYALQGNEVYVNFPFGIASLRQLQEFSDDRLPVPGGTVNEAKRLFLFHLKAVQRNINPQGIGLDMPAEGGLPPRAWEVPKSHPRYRAAGPGEAEAMASASPAGDDVEDADAEAEAGVEDDEDEAAAAPPALESPQQEGRVDGDGDTAMDADGGQAAEPALEPQAQPDGAEGSRATPQGGTADAPAPDADLPVQPVVEDSLPGLTLEDIAGGVHLTFAKARCKRSIARLFHVRKLIALAQRCSMLRGLSNVGGAHSVALQSAASRNGARCAQRLSFLEGARNCTSLQEKPQNISFGKNTSKNMPPSLASWLASVALLGDGALNGSVQGHWVRVGPHVQHLHVLAGTAASGMVEAGGGKDDSAFAYSFDMSVPVDTSKLKPAPASEGITAGQALTAEGLTQLIPHPEYAGVYAVGEEAVEVVQDREALGADGVYFAEAGGVEGDTVPSSTFSAPRWLAAVQMPRKGAKDARGRHVPAGLTVLGGFECDADAARAHDREMVHLFGAGEKLNFPEDWGLAPSLAARTSKPADYPATHGVLPLTQPQRCMQQLLAAAVQSGKHYSTALQDAMAASSMATHAHGEEEGDTEYQGTSESTRSGRVGGRKRPAEGARGGNVRAASTKKRRIAAASTEVVATSIPCAAGNLAPLPPLPEDATTVPAGAMAARTVYAGVTPTWVKPASGGMKLRWAARIMNAADKTVQHLGVFRTEVGAARAFDAAAYQRRRAVAQLNFPEEWSLPASNCALKRGVRRRSWEAAVAAVQLDARGDLRVPPGESRDVFPLCSAVAGADPSIPVGEEHCSLFGVVRISEAAWAAFLPMTRSEASLGQGGAPVRLRLGQFSLAYNAARVVDFFNLAYNGPHAAQTNGRWLNFSEEVDAFVEQLQQGQGLPGGLLAPLGGFGEAAPSVETRRTALLVASQMGIGKGVLKGPASVPGTTAPLSVEGTPEDLAAAIALADIGSEGPLDAKEIARLAAAAKQKAAAPAPAPAPPAAAASAPEPTRTGGTKRPRQAEANGSKSGAAGQASTSKSLTVTVSSAGADRASKRPAVSSSPRSRPATTSTTTHGATAAVSSTSFSSGETARMAADSAAARRAEAHAAATAAAQLAPPPTGPVRPDTTLIASMAKAVQTALHPLHAAAARAWQNTERFPQLFRSAMGDTQSASAVAAATGAFAAFGPAASVTGLPGAGHVSTAWLGHLPMADTCSPAPPVHDGDTVFDASVDDAPGLVPNVGPLSALCTLTECAAGSGGDQAQSTLRALKTHRRQAAALHEALGGGALHSVALPRKFVRTDAAAEAGCVGMQPLQGTLAAAAAGVTCDAAPGGAQPLLNGAFVWGSSAPMPVGALQWGEGAQARTLGHAQGDGLKVRLKLHRPEHLTDESAAPLGAVPVNPHVGGGSGTHPRAVNRWEAWLQDATPEPYDLRIAPTHAPVYLPSMVSAAPVMFSRLAAVPPNALPASLAAEAGKLEAHAAATRLSTLHVRHVRELEQAAVTGVAPDPSPEAEAALRKVAEVAAANAAAAGAAASCTGEAEIEQAAEHAVEQAA